ncbi:MAG: LLM class flavin-dependent oxidoreductase [Gammaproteobacteria bacterium]|jgi:probable F420-dependent oxidoreductase
MTNRKRRTGLMLWPVPGLDAGFERALWAETAGYDDIWLADAEALPDPITLAAAIGVATTSIRLCTGIVPVFNRPPPLLATAVVAAEAQAPGRFALGLGASTQNMIERWYGLPFGRPLTRIRETVALLRQIFNGEKTAFEGQTLSSRGFQLKTLPSAPVPINLAAIGPKMLQLAGEIADGVMLNDFTPPDRLEWALAQLDIGAKRAGRRADDLEIIKRRAFLVVDDRQSGFDFFRDYLGNYGSAPAYQQAMINLGYLTDVEKIRAGHAKRDRAAIANAIPDSMIERLFAFGSEDDCRALLDADFAAGVDTVVVSPQARTAAQFERAAVALKPPR